jgi:hypothetical protein
LSCDGKAAALAQAIVHHFFRLRNADAQPCVGKAADGEKAPARRHFPAILSPTSRAPTPGLYVL